MGPEENGGTDSEGSQQASAGEGPSTAIWVLLAIPAVFIDAICIALDFLLGAGFILDSLIKPPAVFLFKLILKAAGVGKGDEEALKKFNKIANILGFSGFFPFISSLPQCTAILVTAYVIHSGKKALATVAPVARGVQKVAGVAKYAVPEAAVVEGAAGGVARTAEGLQRGESISQAGAAGATEGIQNLAGGIEGGGLPGEAEAAGGTNKATGVGEQYGVGKIATEKKTSPVKAQAPQGGEGGGDESGDIEAEVARRAELDSPYADLPEEMTEGPISSSGENGSGENRFGGKVISAADYLARQKKKDEEQKRRRLAA